MKKAILLIAAGIISMSAVANGITVPESGYDKYCAKLKDGKVVVVMQDKSDMTANVKLENGTVIGTDGTITKPDGSKVALKDGECIDRDGNISEKGKMKDDKSKDAKSKDGKSKDGY